MTDRSQVDNTTALIAEARDWQSRGWVNAADQALWQTTMELLADALEAAERRASDAEGVMLAIANATSGPGDGPSDAEMIAGVVDALSMAAVQRARAALEAVTVERDSLSRLHEVATERTVKLAAVILEARGVHKRRDDIVLDAVLNASDADAVLREHDAKVLEEFADSCLVDPSHGWGYGAIPVGRIKSHAAALRVGANPKEGQ